MDCGEGAQRRILGEGLGLNKDTTVLVTHLHGDHVTGLLGLLQTMSLAQRQKPLTIVGPKALERWLDVTSELLHIGLTFPVFFKPARPGVVHKTKWFKVKATRAVHSVEAYAYLLIENDRPGVFYPEKAKAAGVPEGKLWSKLQAGKPVTLGTRTVRPEAVAGAARPGRRVGYSGDSRPSSALARFFKGVDLLIFDSTFAAKDREKAVERKHSTCREAAEIAKRAGARRLVLTHFSARYSTVAPLVRQAREIFPQTSAASDGLTLTVDYSVP